MSLVSWKQTQDGFELVDGPCAATLIKSGSMWELTVARRVPIVLGRRATFDSAEAAIRREMERAPLRPAERIRELSS